ncbi:MAG: FliM/FliN family flagellar motor switch protein [Pseudomonadota bacterium]|nr:FliM/FliN family flagellar motor switch protein [Pseudomonadota bacterium]
MSKIEVELMVLIGSAEMPLARLLRLSRGAVIPLGGDPAEPLQILANGRPVARGRVHLDGERVTVEVTEASRAV